MVGEARSTPGAGEPLRRRRRLSGLQFRTTITYALTTVAAVLVVEIILAAIVWLGLTSGPLVQQWTIAAASQTARQYALAAAAKSGGQALDPGTTFEPGQPGSIVLFGVGTDASAATGFSGGRGPQPAQIPVFDSQAPPANSPFAMLVRPDGRVLASTMPARYPSGALAADLLPAYSQPIAKALAGQSASTDEAPQGDSVAAVEPVLGRNQQTIGAVLVQTPTVPPSALLGGFTAVIVASAILWLAFSLPVGGIFGWITTHGLVRRVERLVTATTRFANGELGERVPVVSSDEVGQLEEHFNDMAEQLVESMSQRQTMAEQQARREERARIEQEMRTAQQIQRSLLPKGVPALSGWTFIPYYKPANEVGGDFYDFHAREDGRVGVVIGDVAGKGVPAALVMALTRTMLRTAGQRAASPAEVLSRVNDLLSADVTPGMFATCFYALLDPRSGRVSYANAGHNQPFLRRADDVVELTATGMPLGMMPGMSYDDHEVTLSPGDRVLFYSDGLVEAHNPTREMLGFPRLAELVADVPNGDAMIPRLLEHLSTFTGPDWEQEDDVTLLTVECCRDGVVYAGTSSSSTSRAAA